MDHNMDLLRFYINKTSFWVLPRPRRLRNFDITNPNVLNKRLYKYLNMFNRRE